jgi:hypothetical protein
MLPTQITKATCDRLAGPVRRCKPMRDSPYKKPVRFSVSHAMHEMPVDADSPSTIPNAVIGPLTPDTIPKPPGDAGKPGGAGYCIETSMKWSPADYIEGRVSNWTCASKTWELTNNQQTFIKGLCDVYLLTSKPYTKQVDEDLRKVVSIVRTARCVIAQLLMSLAGIQTFPALEGVHRTLGHNRHHQSPPRAEKRQEQ